MATRQYLGFADYIVFGVSLLIPVVIGFKFRNSGSGKHGSVGQYFLANRKADMVPVVMSAAVSTISAITIIGVPAQVYKFGSVIGWRAVSPILGQIIASFVFIPVYFQCGVSSIYEFLEMRYGKYTRYTTSALFIIQMVLYICVTLLGPVIAINAVTAFSMEAAIFGFGAICTLYCVLGGLKAVLWSDLFQSVLMFVCLICLFAASLGEVGSLHEVSRRASEGGRLNYLDFRFDFVTRYTAWNSLSRGFSYGLACWGTSQLEVQRWLSMSSCERAQRALYWSIFPVCCLQSLAIIIGLLLYAVFYLCDPVQMADETGISKYDQIVPFFIVSRLHSIPGLTGVCMAGIFSGSLSTMSSALNSLATVTMVDFVQPTFPALSSTRALIVAKLLGLFYGILCIGLTYTMLNVNSILQAGVTFFSLYEGPILAIFSVGMLTRKVSDKSAVVGLISGVCLICWIGFGSLFGGYRSPSLPLTTTGCPANQNVSTNNFDENSLLSSTVEDDLERLIAKNNEIFPMYKIPFYWLPTMGFVFTTLILFLNSLLLDCNKNIISRDSKLLSPITRYWMKTSKRETPEHVEEMTVLNG